MFIVAFLSLRLLGKHGVKQLSIFELVVIICLGFEEAIKETSGSISIFYYADIEVRFGLPIMIDSLDAWQKVIKDRDHYACTFCGFTEKLEPATNFTCPECKKNKWVKASNKKRIR